MNASPPRYTGPRSLAESLSAFARMTAADASWNREGLREDSEYRDLGLAAATNGRIGALSSVRVRHHRNVLGCRFGDEDAKFFLRIDLLARVGVGRAGPFGGA